MKSLKGVLESLHPLERRVIIHLKDGRTAREIAFAGKMQNVEALRALQWLESKGIVSLHKTKIATIILEKNGRTYVKTLLPEKQFLKVLLEHTHKLGVREAKQLMKLDDAEFSVALGLLKRKGYINLGKEISVTKKGEAYFSQDQSKEKLLQSLPKDQSSLTASEKSTLKELQDRRGVVGVEERKIFGVKVTSLGKKVMQSDLSSELLDAMTPALIKKGTWKLKKFRRYDIKASTGSAYGAKRHMVAQANEYIRRIWLDMGFTEQVGSYVESSFWNFDVLFTPQDHPAREMQDTFFIDNQLQQPLPSFAKKVKAVHQNGGTTGSKGWRVPWSEKEAKQPVLITHDTGLSAHVLSEISEKDLPVKTFQIMKVFRNEAVDWKHLFEFYQVGGIVVDKNANFSHLIGYLKQFFGKMGFTDIRLRPAHFPYTEPSCEVEVFDPRKKEWVELGGAGVFRPEVVKPLLGFDCPVLAWGLGIERIVKDYYKITNLRDIYKNDLKKLRESPMWVK